MKHNEQYYFLCPLLLDRIYHFLQVTSVSLKLSPEHRIPPPPLSIPATLMISSSCLYIPSVIAYLGTN